MIVHIGATGATLSDADNFRGLAVSTALGDEALRETVQAHAIGAVDADDEHVWLDPDALRAAAGDGADASWSEGFAAMVGYAAGHGWTDDQGRVRAHIERS